MNRILVAAAAALVSLTAPAIAGAGPTFPMQALLMIGPVGSPAQGTERDEVIALVDHARHGAAPIYTIKTNPAGHVTVLRVVSPDEWYRQYPQIAREGGIKGPGDVWLVEIQDMAGTKVWVQSPAVWIPCLGGDLSPHGIQPPTKDCARATGAVPK